MIDRDFVDTVCEIAVNESKVFYLAQWAMSAIDGARAQRFEEITDEVINKIRSERPLYEHKECNWYTKRAIAQELQEYYESESRF